MTLASWSDLLDDVMPELPGCMPAMALKAIKNATSDLCTESKVLTEDSEPLSLVANQHTYDIVLASNDVSAYSVKHVLYKGEPLQALTESWCDSRLESGWRAETGNLIGYLSPNPLTLRLVRTPTINEADVLVATLIVAPKSSSAGPVDWLVEKFGDDIAAGAKARLMLQPRKPWTNPQLAAFYENQFRSGIGKAKAIAARGHGQAVLRTRTYAR